MDRLSSGKPKNPLNKGTERRRRTAYRSGRLELIGFKGPANEFKPKRSVSTKVVGSVLGSTHKHKSWRRY